MTRSWSSSPLAQRLLAVVGRRQVNHLIRFLPALPLLRELGGGTLLDVGSGSQGLRSVLGERWRVTMLDADFSDYGAAAGVDGDASQILGDVRELPFADGTFDAVTALDLLEHVPPEDRDRAVRELCRVASRLAVIACPTGETSLAADRRIAERLRARGRAVPGWLEEHDGFGLPDASVAAGAAAGYGEVTIAGNESIEAHERLVLAELDPLRALPLRLAAARLEAGLRSDRPRARALAAAVIRRLGGSDAFPTYRTVVAVRRGLQSRP